MPYITPSERSNYETHLNEIKKIKTKGDLEFCIWKLMKIYMSGKKFSYTELHNTAYAAIHCGDEFRRRYLDARENVARRINGDIFPSINGDHL